MASLTSSDEDVVFSGSAASEGVSISVHPLPLLNISEHYTRVRIQAQSSTGSNDDDVKVIGALIGTQQGREIEIINSFELALSNNGQDVNHDFFTTRQNQFKQVFPTFEFLGWYTVGNRPTSLDLSLHTQLLAYNESPLLLILSASGITSSARTSTSSSNLPLDIYESIVDIAGEKSVNKFVRIAGGDASSSSGGGGGYKIETGEAERIAVESASRQAVASQTGVASGGNKETIESTLVAGLTTQRNAVSMLHQRIATILQYLSLVQNGTLQPDHETLRQINSLVSSVSSKPPSSAGGPTSLLPSAAPSAPEAIAMTAPPALHPTSNGTSGGSTALDHLFKEEFNREQNDVLLTSILAQMTKNLESANVLIDKFSVQQFREVDDFHHGPGMMGGGGGGGMGKRSGKKGGMGRRGTQDGFH